MKVRAPGSENYLRLRGIMRELARNYDETALLTAFLNELPPDARVLRAECSPALSEMSPTAPGRNAYIARPGGYPPVM